MQNDHDKDIALIKQDVSYIKKDLALMKDDTSDMKKDLRAMLEHYITRNEVEARMARIELEVDTRIKGLNNRVDTKLDKEEFAPVKKLGLLIITAVIIALLALIGLK